MRFACPGCAAPVQGPPDGFMIRCPSCRAVIRSRAVDTASAAPTFEVEVAGRPETRRRVEVPWDEDARRRLSAWLLVASLVTLALVLVLFTLARAL